MLSGYQLGSGFLVAVETCWMFLLAGFIWAGILIKLYDYFSAGAAYRLALFNLEGYEYEQEAVHLTKDGGEQFQAEYDGINPQNLVPTLIDNERTFFQSINYGIPLEVAGYCNAKPAGSGSRARVRALANIVL